MPYGSSLGCELCFYSTGSANQQGFHIRTLDNTGTWWPRSDGKFVGQLPLSKGCHHRQHLGLSHLGALEERHFWTSFSFELMVKRLSIMSILLESAIIEICLFIITYHFANFVAKIK